MNERELFFGTLSLMDIFDTILTSFPEGFLIFFIGLAFFNESIKQWWHRGVFAGAFYCIGMHLVYYYELRVDLKFLALYMIQLLIFKPLWEKSWLKTFGMVSMAYTFSLVGYLIMFVTLNFFGITAFDFFTDHTYTYPGMALYLLFLLASALTLNFFKFNITEVFPKIMNMRTMYTLAIVACVELYSLSLLGLSYYLDQLDPNNTGLFTESNRPILPVIAFAAFIVGIFAFRRYLWSTVDHVEQEASHSYGSHIQDLLTSMSSIRHDVINHMTVIEGLLKKDMHDKALQYLQTLNREHAEVIEQIDGINDTSISSLIASKAQTCQRFGIPVITRIQTSKQFSFVDSVDLVRILGNLLDNAIAATNKRLSDERYIHITWTDRTLSIENTGPILTEDFISKMFSLGVSTKGKNGGSGLAIVRKTVRKYGGDIEVSSHQGVTKFMIMFPELGIYNNHAAS